MATEPQIAKLRRKIQDFYDKRTNAELEPGQHAFHREELEDILDDAFAEVTEGKRDATTATPRDVSMAMLVARADAMLQIAQDEARRIRWEEHNTVIDPTRTAQNLAMVSRELRLRYESHKDRELKKEIEGIDHRPIGTDMVFNTSVKRNSARDFDNATVRRNTSPDHSL